MSSVNIFPHILTFNSRHWRHTAHSKALHKPFARATDFIEDEMCSDAVPVCWIATHHNGVDSFKFLAVHYQTKILMYWSMSCFVAFHMRCRADARKIHLMNAIISMNNFPYFVPCLMPSWFDTGVSSPRPGSLSLSLTHSAIRFHALSDLPQCQQSRICLARCVAMCYAPVRVFCVDKHQSNDSGSFHIIKLIVSWCECCHFHSINLSRDISGVHLCPSFAASSTTST